MVARIALAAAVVLFAAGTGWGQWIASEEAKLKAAGAKANDLFGESVAVDGDTAVVGAIDYSGSGPGFVRVYVRSGTTWTEQAQLTGSVGSFGESVAIHGDTAVVGEANGTGRAHVFIRNGTTWTLQATLQKSNPALWDDFGFSVSMWGGTVVVGAPSDDTAAGIDAGSVAVFVRNGAVWSQQAEFEATDASPDDAFGVSVSIWGDQILVGASGHDLGTATKAGAAYVFARVGNTWNEQMMFLPLPPAGTNKAVFGRSVSLFEGTAIIGAPFETTSYFETGSVYVFVQNGTVWNLQQTLLASDQKTGDEFGDSVAVIGDTLVVGAPYDDDPLAGMDTGSAYLFSRGGTTWNEQAKITASDGRADDIFGWSVAISGDTVFAGAPLDTYGGLYQAGSAYVFGIVPESPVNYCTAGISASGCQALLSAAGTASATAPSGFGLTATNAEGAKDGLFFFGTSGQQANPWGNGTSYQCVVPPVKRCGLLAGTGTIGACDGSLSQDLNAFWCPTCPKPHKNPGAGAVVQLQLWYRDPLSTSNQTTSLSDAIEFVVGP